MTVQLGVPVLRPARNNQGAAPEPRPAGLPSALLDQFGRQATDMRLSVTDKCNLRCTYCMPAGGLRWLPKQAVMTAGEIQRIVGIGVERLGVRELRITGGEPLVRLDLVDIIAALRARHARLPISMTTNGVGLEKKAQALRGARLTRINVSLDSLHEDVFTQLTRRPFLGQVLAGVEEARAAGLGPVKINAVLMRGVNDHEAPVLLEWALKRNVELRFIEQIPLDAERGWSERGMITASEIQTLLSAGFVLERDRRSRDGAPAERYEVRRRNAVTGEASGPALGTVGIIASVSEPLCSDCRRTRVTAEGKIMSCLFSRKEFDLLGLLRTGAHDDELVRLWQDAMWMKPRAHGMDHTGLGSVGFVQPERSMSAIGG